MSPECIYLWGYLGTFFLLVLLHDSKATNTDMDDWVVYCLFMCLAWPLPLAVQLAWALRQVARSLFRRSK